MSSMLSGGTNHEQAKEDFRKELWGILHDGEGLSGRAYNFLLIVLILLSLALLPLEFIDAFKDYHDALAIIEIVTTSIFTVEYFMHIYAAPRRLRYIFSFYGLIDLLSIAPFYVGLLGTQYVRALRVVRLFRLGEIQSTDASEKTAESDQITLIEGESVEHIVRHHPFFLFVGCITPIIAATPGIALFLKFPGNPVALSAGTALLLFSIIFLWKAWLDYVYDVIIITNHRMILQNQHILGRSINQINYMVVANVKPYYPTIFHYFLRAGSLIIETPAADIGRIELHMVRRHEHAADIIMQKCVLAGAQAVQH